MARDTEKAAQEHSTKMLMDRLNRWGKGIKAGAKPLKELEIMGIKRKGWVTRR